MLHASLFTQEKKGVGCSSGYLIDIACALDRGAVNSCEARSWFILYDVQHHSSLKG